MKRLISALMISVVALVFICGATPTATGQGKKPSLKELKQTYRAKVDKIDKGNADDHVKLAIWCEANSLKAYAKRHLNKALKIDPNHSNARKRLGHIFEKGKWLTKEEVEKLKAKEDAATAKARGLVKYKGKWVAKEDIAKMKAGMVKVEGDWVTKEEAEKMKAGFAHHPETGEWIKKEDLPKAQQGLFPLGSDKWGSLEEANKYHANWSTRWRLATKHYWVHTNLPWTEAEKRKGDVEVIYGRIKNVLNGNEPNLPRRMNVYIFATQGDYNAYGNQAGNDYSSIMGGWFSIADKTTPSVCYWDKNFGRIFLPHAMSFQYTFFTFVQAGFKEFDFQRMTFKGLPVWIMPGVAAYCDRFWDRGLRKWGANNITKNGGLANFGKSWFKGFEIMAGSFAKASEQGIRNAGFLITYVRHSNDDNVRKLWDAIWGGIKDGEKSKAIVSHIKKLQTYISKNNKKVRAYFEDVQTGR